MCLWLKLETKGLAQPGYHPILRDIVSNVLKRSSSRLLVFAKKFFIAPNNVGLLTRIGTSIYVSKLMIVRMTNTIKRKQLIWKNYPVLRSDSRI